MSAVAFAASYHPLLEGHPAAVIADEALKPSRPSESQPTVEHDAPRIILLSEDLPREVSGVGLGNRPRDVLDYFSHELIHLLNPSLAEATVHEQSKTLSSSMRQDCPHLDPGLVLATQADEHVLACWAATNGVQLLPSGRPTGAVGLLASWWNAFRRWFR